MIERRARARGAVAPLAGLRSAVAAGPLLLRRRARRDGVLLVVWTLTVAFASILAVAGPAHLARTIDAGAREAVETAGPATDLVIEVAVANPNSTQQAGTVAPADVDDVAGAARERLPPALGRAHSATTVAVTGPRNTIGATEVQPALADSTLSVQLTLAMLTADGSAALELVDGALPAENAPTDEQTSIEVAVSDAAASATSLGVGSVIRLPAFDPDTGEEAVLPALVVGIVGEKREPGDRLSPWRDIPEVWEPTTLVDGRSTIVGITVLTPPGAISRAVQARGNAFSGVLRYSFDPASFTADSLAAAATEASRLTANGGSLIDGYRYGFDVDFSFADAVADFPAQARATLAELSIIVAGVVGVAAAVLLLVSQLIVHRRLADVLLERARGASIVTIGMRTLAGSAVSVGIALLIALLIALGIARIAGSGITPVVDPAPLVAVVVVALVAGVVQTVAAIGLRSTASAVGVNRRDALRRVRRRLIARIAIEIAVLALAIAAIVALLDRGLLQTASDGVDPLIAAAPLLSAAAVTVVVLRASRWPVHAVVQLAGRSRGIAGPVVSSRLLRALAIVPLTALTVAVALVVGTGLIGQAVREGQVAASWQRVGADVRVEARMNEEDVARVASADGVSVASGSNVRTGLQLSLGTSRSGVALFAVDRSYPRLVAGLPDVDGVTDASDAEEFALLSDEVADDAPLPVIVDTVVAERLISDDVSVRIGDTDVALSVVGSVRSGPTGYLDAPSIYVDLTSLSSRLNAPLLPNTLLALGAGAAGAIDRLDAEASDVLTRSGWLAERRDLALVAGVQQAVLVGAAVLALLSLVAIVSATLAGSAERARYLALLRTLGVHSRFGILLAAVDQVPLMLASLIGGVLAGVGIAVLLAPALGLEFLTGGLSAPPPTIPAGFLLLVLGGVVLVFTIGTLIEVLLRRRDRVSDTIRVGETI